MCFLQLTRIGLGLALGFGWGSFAIGPTECSDLLYTSQTVQFKKYLTVLS